MGQDGGDGAGQDVSVGHEQWVAVVTKSEVWLQCPGRVLESGQDEGAPPGALLQSLLSPIAPRDPSTSRGSVLSRWERC